jgi:reactive intermediate/imine deaminase
MRKITGLLLTCCIALIVSAAIPTNWKTMTAGMADFPSSRQPDYPFSKVMRAGDLVFVSGQIGVKPDGKLAEGFEAQSKQTMDNLAEALKSEGLTMDDVVKCTVMIGDMSKWNDFNVVYRTYFKPGKFPARSAFGANGLALGADLEVECIAYAPLKSKTK